MKIISNIQKGLIYVFLLSSITISCKKENPVEDQDEALHEVSFSIENFQSMVEPFEMPVTKSSKSKLFPVLFPDQPQVLAYWSFDNGDNKPTFSATQDGDFNLFLEGGTPTYIEGFVIDPSMENPKDKRVRIPSFRRILLELKMNNIDSFDRIEFDFASDVKSPIGGRLCYQLNSGPIIKTEEFFRMKSATSSLKSERISLKVPKLPERITNVLLEVDFTEPQLNPNVNYREPTVNHIDNIRLYGHLKSSVKYQYEEKPYFIFNKENGELVEKGEYHAKDSDKTNLKLSLVKGMYYTVMLHNQGDDKLLFPTSLKDKTELYATIPFNQRVTQPFGVLDSFEVKEPTKKTITLSRLYSLITLDFTDLRDLSIVKTIKIKPPAHSLYAWTPLNPSYDQKLSGIKNEAIISHDFNVHPEVTFSHFLGLQENEVPVEYVVEIWDESKLLRSFQLKSAIKNDVKLKFIGELYPLDNSNSHYEVMLDKNWKGAKIVEFK